MTPLQRYERDLLKEDFAADSGQRLAITHLQRLYEDLVSSQRRTVGYRRWMSKVLSKPKAEPVKGIYLWGGVGRGKTYLVDAFYECLPFENKLREHFHRFMRRIHKRLHELKGQPDPLDRVAEGFARRSRVICLDEFHVSDITDAMLLGNLLQSLFSRGVAVVATSNEVPQRLYWDGLQRERFLTAIAAIEAHMEIVNVDGGVDYRLRALERAEIYHSPLDLEAGRNLSAAFEELAPDHGQVGVAIEIEGREINTVRCADGVVWFEFDDLCNGPRSSADYIELGRCYQTILIGEIPQLTDLAVDAARRFVTLIDELYDRNVKIIVSAAVPPEELYQGVRLQLPFARTVSRLQEMRSHEYLTRPHLSD